MSEQDYIVCRVCFQEFLGISASHLLHKHGMTHTDYRQRFPDANLTSESTRRKHGDVTSRRVWSDQSLEILSKSITRWHGENPDARRGEKNPNWGQCENHKRVTSSLEFREKMSHAQKGRKHSDESKKKMSEAQHRWWAAPKHRESRLASLRTPEYREKQRAINLKNGHSFPIFRGPDHYNWQGGKGSLPYPPEFNKPLKNRVRELDKYVCQMCGKTEEENVRDNGRVLNVHHIDYDKMNNAITNLISLCDSCHSHSHPARQEDRDILLAILARGACSLLAS